MSERKGEEEEKAGPSKKAEEPEETPGSSRAMLLPPYAGPEETEEDRPGPSHRMMLPSYTGQYEEQSQQILGQEPSTSRLSGAIPPQYAVPHPPLEVKRPGRPRIHPPKPVGISKPRGRPRGSKNKKPRKRRDPSTLVERPPKRPRGRPRIWPPEMWEGFQRSQYLAATQKMQQIQRQQSQEMPGPSHLYYEEQLPHQMPPQEEPSSSVPPPLSHLPFHMVSQQEPQELSHLMPLSQQPQSIQQQPPHPHHLHHPVHSLPPPPHPMQRQDEQMLLIRQPLYLQEQQEQQHQREQQQQAEMLRSQQEEQQRRYYHEQMQHPPHTTS
ncbi:uncharacterized protein LOC120327741 isoform X2 [Styela clava]|uniref:pollen-specific leucine-rich repeat extensin-like protein 1 isoform X2 n=1 Tax=Styela clava TaxID=7725 RepID=UPI00193A5888|nr:pollen-specific leucine-rich repeat extensin-like protein 1 isoform X2 [Styela clava]